MSYQSFKDLEVWKRGCRLAVEVNQTVNDWKNFALKDQMSRASISIPSNIAEGHERDSRPDFIRFLRIAKGSASELRTQCYVARQFGHLPPTDSERFVRECRELSAMLQGLIRSLSPSEN